MTSLPRDRFRVVVFFLSTGRTGTKALAHHLDACCPEVTAVHEPKPSRSLRIASNRHLCGRLGTEELASRYERARRGLLARVGTPVYVESNPFLHGFVPALDQLFPAMKVVHIVRDPRTYVRSHLNFGAFHGVKALLARHHPYWLLRPELAAPETGLRSAAMTPVQRLAWRWDAINARLEQGQALLSERYLRVRYEDLFGGRPDELDALLAWLGLGASKGLQRCMSEQRVNQSRHDSFPRWEQWAERDREDLMALCGTRMRCYGYCDQPA